VTVAVGDPDVVIPVDADAVGALHVRVAADQGGPPGTEKTPRRIEAEDGRRFALDDVNMAAAVDIDAAARTQAHALRQPEEAGGGPEVDRVVRPRARRDCQ